MEEIKNIKLKLPFQRENTKVRKETILSTKKLTSSQKKMFDNTNISVTDYDAIEINLLDFKAPKNISNGIFTSQNAVKAFFSHHNLNSCNIEMVFCVGEKTASLLKNNGQKVTKMMKNASELANFIKVSHYNDTFYFFCGSKRRDEIPFTLNNENIVLFEVKTYETLIKPVKVDQKWGGIIFFSPTGVKSFCSKNDLGNKVSFCIGNTTASEAKKYTSNVFTANKTTVESVIEKTIEILGKT